MGYVKECANLTVISMYAFKLYILNTHTKLKSVLTVLYSYRDRPLNYNISSPPYKPDNIHFERFLVLVTTCI